MSGECYGCGHHVVECICAYAGLGEGDEPRKTASDRVAAYFEKIAGRPMTREEKIPLPAIISGDE